jgi:diguanylate cyclase (GGDEF)-like protein
VTVWDRASAAHLNVLPMLMDELGAAAVATIPIVVNDERVGLVVGDVTDRPDRMLDDPELAGRLRGVASQATIAIRNARLLEGIKHQALHDSLTGLPNRTLILDRIEQMQARSKRAGTEAAALFLDLDGFKHVNDTLGHEAGDRLLKSVAKRLVQTLRAGDTIARLGGDEFVVLQIGVADQDQVRDFAQRIIHALTARKVASASALAIGAQPKPQLPMIVVVMPCASLQRISSACRFGFKGRIRSACESTRITKCSVAIVS